MWIRLLNLVQLPVRRIPLAVKEELQRLESLQIRERVDDPTDWISALVVVRKSNGSLRICIDPKHLNQALRRQRYPMATIDDRRVLRFVTFRMVSGTFR